MWFRKKAKGAPPSILSCDAASLGVVFTGRPGSGKSTGLRLLMADLALQGCIILWTAIKPDEADVAASVLPNAIRFSPESHRFNPIQYEMSRIGGSASNLAAFHDDLSEVLTRADGQKQEAFWKGGAHDTLTHAIELAYHVRKIQGKQATYEDVYDIIMTSATDLAMAKSPAFCETPCGLFLEALGSHAPDIAKKYVDWFLYRLPSVGEKANGAFRTQAINSIKPFLHGPIAKLVNGESSVTPEQMLEQHTILDLDTLTYGIGGLAFQLMMSWLCMEAVLRRKGDFPYFALVRDEYHQLAHPERDVRTQSVGRSQKFIGVTAFQTIPVLEAALSGSVEAQVQAKALYGLHVNKFMMNNNCHVTNEFNSMVIGQEKVMFHGMAMNKQQPEQLAWYDIFGVGAVPNFNFSQQWHFRVPPTAFMQLATGGPDDNWTCEAILHRGVDGYEFHSFKQR